MGFSDKNRFWMKRGVSSITESFVSKTFLTSYHSGWFLVESRCQQIFMQQSSMSDTVVAHLVPLDDSLKQDHSLPKLPISQGPNAIGRANIPLSDKRLSRKHLTLTASTDGSAALFVVTY